MVTGGGSGLGADGFNTTSARPLIMKAMMIADLLRVARKYLDPDHLTLVVAGPRPAAPEKKGDR